MIVFFLSGMLSVRVPGCHFPPQLVSQSVSQSVRELWLRRPPATLLDDPPSGFWGHFLLLLTIRSGGEGGMDNNYYNMGVP